MLSLRIRIILIFLLIMAYFLINTGYTDADIFAERIVQHNRFSAMTLNFSALNSANNNPVSYLFRTNGMQPGGFDLSAVRIKKSDGMNFKYRLKVSNTIGDDVLCKSLKVEVLQRNWSIKYEGKLGDLIIDSIIDSDAPNDWIFFISFDDDDNALQNKICEFSFDFKTYRDNPDETGGIYAERLVNNTIYSGTWLN